MKFHLFQSLALLFVVVVASHASVDPAVINDCDLLARLTLYTFDFVTKKALFILEKDLHKGKNVNLHISKDAVTSPYVPRQVADSLPFTSNKIQDIYKAFKVSPASLEASLIEKTCNKCEKASNKEEDHYCANSLESMVDFASSKLGKRVKAVSTQVDGNESAALQGYKVEGVRKLNGDDAVVCHQQYYGYAVQYCHKASKINAYMVSLVGENNVKAKAISVCHEDTSSWNPKHLAFQVLNVKPATYAVCHFLVENEAAWVPY
ncbi:BURP domain-containing protein 2 [Artemisia annua]|uniref:BURP domain-containing protein 2 n=1 Tax=Artemisia annua TaxID=35608 RepID=A0A2U1Q6G8_ARTAN|nr:BURP domain-containing protein 2 [Artemisia annua]